MDSENRPTFLESVKDKLLGHKDKDTDLTTTEAGVVPVIPVVPVTLHDSHDLDREQLKAADSYTQTQAETHTYATGARTHGTHDSHNQYRNGNISLAEKMAQKIKAAVTGTHDSHELNREHHHGTREGDEAHLRLHEEQLAVSKREVPTGEVGISKRVESEHVETSIPVKRDELVVERRPLSGEADPDARIGAEEDVMYMPLYHEEVTTEKRTVPTEEVIVRKKEETDHQIIGDTLRSEHVDMQTGTTYDTRDTDLDSHASLSEKAKAVDMHKDEREL